MTAQETTYTIREAAKKVDVETHVLRYWEEELGIAIARNAQGHRCYRKEDVELMEKIKQWKAQGMQLKAIRLMLSEDGRLAVPDEVVREAQAMVEKAEGTETKEKRVLMPMESVLLDERSSRAAKLQLLLENLVSRAVQENSAEFVKALNEQFQKLEENAQTREQRQLDREEEHFRKLDALLRQRVRSSGGRRKKRKI